MLKIEALWIDDDTLDKIEGKHGLSFAEVEEALTGTQERCFHRVGGGQVRALSTTGSGAYIAVFLTPLGGGDWRVNTARRMSSAEKHYYKSHKKG